MHCPLCFSHDISDFYADARRGYLRCADCALVFVPSTFFLSPSDEKAQYDLHENSPDDPAYRSFLQRLVDPLNERIAPNSTGLDFGSGPGPTISIMLEEAGHTMNIYDPFYAVHPETLDTLYDFITTTETVEHFHSPKKEFNSLWKCLSPGGYLAIMTKLIRDKESFKKWHYKNDPTHVTFYAIETFEWLAKVWHADIEFIGNDIVFLHKRN